MLVPSRNPTIGRYEVKSSFLKPSIWGREQSGLGTGRTYAVLAEHVEVLGREMMAVLVVVHALRAPALLQLLSHESGLHHPDPRLANLLLARLEHLCAGQSGACTDGAPL